MGFLSGHARIEPRGSMENSGYEFDVIRTMDIELVNCVFSLVALNLLRKYFFTCSWS